MTKIRIFTDPATLSKAVADTLVELSEKSIAATGRFTIALSGGSTPAMLFELLAAEPYNKSLNWKQVYIFWGDERHVPIDDERNNSHQAKKLLLNNIAIPAENIFTIPVKMPAPRAALHYEQTLKAFFKADMPCFDCILLGMGDNGHTASLFPGTAILHEPVALVKEVFLPEQDMYRISFTAPLINHAKNILFLVTGREKSAMLHKVLEGPSQPDKYPAQLIKAGKGNKLFWYIDKAAAARLKKTN